MEQSMRLSTGLLWRSKSILSIVLIWLLSSNAFLLGQNNSQSTGEASSVTGTVTDLLTGETLIGVNILAVSQDTSILKTETTGTVTSVDGLYTLALVAGTWNLTISFVGFETQEEEITLVSGQQRKINFVLAEKQEHLGIMVVSGSFYERNIGEEVVSIDVISSDYINNTNSKTLDEAVSKLPGVYIIDGQTNMRGGTGYSYGVGSRVMLVLDDQPLLSADRSDIKWSLLPVENVEQIEVIKGASSVMYGAGALNGVVHVRTGWPTAKPETKLQIYQGVYGDPRREEMQWWDNNPIFMGGQFSHKRKINDFDLVIGASLGTDQSYILEEFKEHARLNFKTRYRPNGANGRLSYGLNGNIMYYNEGLFLLWNDNNEGALQALTNSSDENSYLWFFADPWLTYFDKANNQHTFKGRYYNITSYFSENNKANAHVISAEYRFQKDFGSGFHLAAGVNETRLIVNDNDLGDHDGNQLSFYAQGEKQIGRLGLSAGIRWETFQLDTFSQAAQPVVKAGLNFKAGKNHYLRASFGQGYRFPGIAERFVDIEVGDVINIFPNTNLKPEIGWNAELGAKQTFTTASWKGYADLAAFWTEYTDMTEFVFGLYPQGLGFKNENVSRARLAGLEFTVLGEGNFGKVPFQILGGYTYVYPADLTIDTTLRSPGKYLSYLWKNFAGEDEAVQQSLLRYRFSHIAKLDFETGYGRFSVGMDLVYFSHMEKIDLVFELIPGIGEYRELNLDGDLVIGVRAAVAFDNQSRLTIIGKNIANKEYSLRPGRLDAPRNIAVQYRIVF
ncbi:MAG: outer membrane receptor protein involved in Fe transport [Limisphaerales bacterium]|jgi:outer membrane receptor protein involved in Fe transport